MNLIIQFVMIYLGFLAQVSIINPGHWVSPQISVLPVLVMILFRWNPPTLAVIGSTILSVLAISLSESDIGWNFLAAGILSLTLLHLPDTWLRKGKISWAVILFAVCFLWHTINGFSNEISLAVLEFESIQSIAQISAMTTLYAVLCFVFCLGIQSLFLRESKKAY